VLSQANRAMPQSRWWDHLTTRRSISIGYISVAVGPSSFFNFSWRAPKDACFVQYFGLMAVQGHPRSLIHQSKARMQFSISEQQPSVPSCNVSERFLLKTVTAAALSIADICTWSVNTWLLDVNCWVSCLRQKLRCTETIFAEKRNNPERKLLH